MKRCLTGIAFMISLMLNAEASGPQGLYRVYLLHQIKDPHRVSLMTRCSMIPKFEIPKGAVFCRLEDKLSRSTGLWIKIGLK